MKCRACNVVMLVTEVQTRNCIRVEYKCSRCGKTDVDFKNIKTTTWGSASTGNIARVQPKTNTFHAAGSTTPVLENYRARYAAWLVKYKARKLAERQTE